MQMRQLSAWVVACIAVVATSGQSPANDSRSWNVYRDAATDISFRYPPDFRVDVIPCPGGVGCLSEVRLYAASSEYPMFALKVNACDTATPKGGTRYCLNEQRLKGFCSQLEPVQMGSLSGFQCISFGTEACFWS